MPAIDVWAALHSKLEWRAKAEAEVAPKLEAYVDSLRTTLGLRLHP
jgi:hypothetical protein